MKVIKFGGSSLASSTQIDKVIQIVQSDANRKFVVVSAPGKRTAEDKKVTDLLIELYQALLVDRSTKEIIKKIYQRYEEIAQAYPNQDTVLHEILQDLTKLNDLKISYLEVDGPDVQLSVGIGEDRCWKGGGGRNIPSFEIFTSPDWRRVEGRIRFNQPLYRYGNVITGVELEIKAGRVVKARAETGEALLLEMLKSPNADKIGEFSLTDKRMSHITHPMAETLFDENIGGPYGNMHLALGMAYQDCYRGDPSQLKKSDWAARGFNDSSEHSDIISTSDRTVRAFLANGQSQIIYRKGQFVI